MSDKKKERLYVTDEFRILVREPSEDLPGLIKMQMKGIMNFAFAFPDRSYSSIDESKFHIRRGVSAFLCHIESEILRAFEGTNNEV